VPEKEICRNRALERSLRFVAALLLNARSANQQESEGIAE
jgi:hypothetical protein